MQRIGYSGMRAVTLAALLVLALGIGSLLLVGGAGIVPSPDAFMPGPVVARPAPPRAVPANQAAQTGQAPAAPAAPDQAMQIGRMPAGPAADTGRAQSPATAEQQSTRPPELGQPVAGSQAAAEVSRIDVNSAANGVEVTLRLRNLQQQELTFPFDPTRALSLSDAGGHPYRLAWAEFDGQPRIPSDGEVRLVRAFFVGSGDNAAAERLLLQVGDVPGLGDARFELQLPQPPVSPLAADDVARGAGLTVGLSAAKVEPEAGGVEITLSVANTGADDLAFSFSPQHDLTLADADGNSYNLEWAEYAGQVELKAGGQAQLVHARFRGPVERAKGKHLLVRVRNLPRVGGSLWSVPVP
ncbi:MAG: hypothetical protein HY331_12740 [Chloroflexi bacterium]|nr:hypothetical protein [Chloroflexota bacterium]